MSAAKPRSCREPDCTFPALKGRQRCGWHWLAAQPIDTQEHFAQVRLARAPRPYILRQPAITGGRWCSGCQSWIPTCYVQGSKCLACSRRAKRASHVARTYMIDPTEERQLRAWQHGRCFICGKVARTRELAVDHDHETGAVRGLLCSDENHGCNVLLRHLLGDIDAARRLLAYAERTPLERMRAGEASPFAAPPARDDGAPPF